MSNLGLGVMINMFGGNEETVKVLQTCIGKKIKQVALVDNELHFEFNDGSKMMMYDDGQSCCESRYMVTDDDLTEFTNTILKGAQIKDAPEIEDEYGSHEVQFLEIETGKGSFVCSNHNEHNGYYGGFWIVCKMINP